VRKYVLTSNNEIKKVDESNFSSKEIAECMGEDLIDLLEEGDLSEDIFDNIVLVDNPKELHFQKNHYQEFPEQLFAIWKRQGNIFRRYVK